MPQERLDEGAARQACVPVQAPDSPATGIFVSPADLGGDTHLVGPGDRLRLHLAGDEDRLTGVYVLADDGTLGLPGLPPINAAGLTEAGLQVRVAHSLAAHGVIRSNAAFVDLRLIESAGVSVSVSGAVFDAGTVRAGERQSENRVGQREGLASGDANPAKTVATALRAAGGVRPDADVRAIVLERGGRWTRLDLSPMVNGRSDADLAVADGDRLIVASTGCFQPDLARPTPITAPGIRVYMSNLTRPASSNASSAIGKDSTSLPYGTRMLQALVAMNCVGGSAMNDGRRAVLISRNPMSGTGVVIQRDVERLVRNANRDAVDPYLMPGDALACYDSRWMNFQDIVSLVSSAASVATPVILLKSALKP